MVNERTSVEGTTGRHLRERGRFSARQRVAAAMLVILSVLAIVWIRGRSQSARVAALLRFGASIEARYGAYVYEPPPSMKGIFDGGSFQIVLGGGQRTVGVKVVDYPPEYIPPEYIDWIVSAVGEHCFTRVSGVSIHDDRFSDKDIDLVLAFSDLREIDLSGTSISDAGARQLTSFDRLVVLDLSGTRVSRESLADFVRCRELKELNIRDTNADEAVITFLEQELPNCWIRSNREGASE